MTPKYKVGDFLIYTDTSTNEKMKFEVVEIKRGNYRYRVFPNDGSSPFINSIPFNRLHQDDIQLETKLHKVLE